VKTHRNLMCSYISQVTGTKTNFQAKKVTCKPTEGHWYSCYLTGYVRLPIKLPLYIATSPSN